MKKTLAILCTLLSLSAAAQKLTGSRDNLTASNHPRLVIDEDCMASIREQVKDGSNEALGLIHQSIMAKTDELLKKKPLVYKKDASGKRILGVSRDAAQRISYCAYAYRFTGERKYLQKAVETIYTVCEFSDWNSRHYLDVCEMASGVAIGYDWLYSELEPEARRLIEEKLKEYAFDTMDLTHHENIWAQMNNRNQVNLAGLVCAALAVYEVFPEIAETLFARVVDSNFKVAEYIYNPDGAYPEGPGYWHYGTCYQVWMNMLFKENLGTDFGLSDIPGFRKTPWFEVFALGSTGNQFNYCDCRQPGIAHYPLWYFADLLGDPSMLYSELAYLKSHDYTDSQQRALVFMALKYAAGIKSSDIKPSPKGLYVADGATPVAIARSGWGPQDLWVAMKGGKTASSHSHMDIGEFVYDAYGVRWSKDVYFYPYDVVEKPIKKLGGNYWDYSQESMRWMVSRVNCHWHSCLILDEEDLLVDGFAKVTDSFESFARKGATLDLTPLYRKVDKVERTVAIRDNDYLEVTDRISCGKKAHTVRFNLVSEAEPFVVNDGILLKKNGVTVKLQAIGAEVTYRTWSADPAGRNEFPFEETAPDTYICGFTAKLPKKTTTVIVTTVKRVVTEEEKDPVAVGKRICEHFLTCVPEAFKPKGYDGPGVYGKGLYVHYAVVSLWTNALDFARRCGDTALERRLTEKFEPFFGEKKDKCNPANHVDYSVFGALPLEIYLHNGDRRALELGLHYADTQWSRLATDCDPALGSSGNLSEEEQVELQRRGYSPQTRFWIDDMYMINVLQTQAFRATGDISYVERAASEMVMYLEKLQRPGGLFHHAPDVPFHWGRGDGWMAAGMPMLLQYLPSNNPDYEPILAAYRKMMAALLPLQRADGLWGQLLDDPDSWSETSCSAMVAYAFLTGVKHGWLPSEGYEEAAMRAWNALCARLDSDANLAGVCIGTNRVASRDWYMTRPRANGDAHGQAAMLWICNTLLSD